MGNGRENVKNNGVLDGFMDRDLTESYSRALTDAVNGGNSNECIFVTIYRNDKYRTNKIII